MKNKSSNLKLNSSKKGLSICIEKEGFSFAIIGNDRIDFARSFIFKALSDEKKLKEITSYFEQEKELNQDFEKVSLAFANNKQMLIPAELYSEEQEEEFLQFNLTLSKGHVINRNYIKNYDSYLIFSYKEEFEEVLKNRFPKVKVLHLASCFLSALKPSLDKQEIHLMIYMGKFDLVFLNKGKLIFYNFFKYKTKEDILYYVFSVIKCEGIKNNDFFVFLEGKISYLSEIYLFLANYIENIEIKKSLIQKTKTSYLEFNFLLTSFQCALSQEN